MRHERFFFLSAVGVVAPVAAQLPAVCCIAPREGPDIGGMLVTIRGSSLATATSVTMGGVALENLIVVDDRTLTGNVPAHAIGAVDVSVTTASGTARLPSGFTFRYCAAAAGTALHFAGAQRVVFGNGTMIQQNTLEAWVKVASGVRSGSTVLTVQTSPDNPCGEGYHLWDFDNDLRYVVDHLGCGSGQSLAYTGPSTNIWTHLAGTFDGTDMSLYVNGRLVQRAPVTRQWPIPTARYAIAGDYSFCCGVHAFYAGELDELRIWSRARTAQEIRDGMHRQLRGDELGLVAYWRLDEGSGTQARPTGVGTVGTLGSGAGMPQWVPSGAIICADMPEGRVGSVTDQGGRLWWRRERCGLWDAGDRQLQPPVPASRSGPRVGGIAADAGRPPRDRRVRDLRDSRTHSGPWPTGRRGRCHGDGGRAMRDRLGGRRDRRPVARPRKLGVPLRPCVERVGFEPAAPGPRIVTHRRTLHRDIRTRESTPVPLPGSASPDSNLVGKKRRFP